MKKLLQFILISFLWCPPVFAASQFDFLLSQVRTTAGGAIIGGTVTFYAAGTTNLQTIWLDRYQTTPASNPYTLDANGTAQIYGAGSYRIVIKDYTGVTVFDRDNIVTAGDDGSISPVDATSGNQTFLLPAGRAINIVKTDSTANTVTVQPSVAGQTINGLASYTLYIQNESVRLALSNTTWYVE
jgi:hypothetical protein